jgi:hypothetical protein
LALRSGFCLRKKQEKALSKKELKKLKAIIEQQLDEREENQQP